MKRAVLITFVVFFFGSAAEAKDSKEYTFMMTIINVLECLQSVMDEDATEGDGLTEMMSKAMIRNNRLTDAKNIIKPYSKSKDDVVNIVVKGFNVGIDLLIDGNIQFVKNARKLSNAQRTEDLKDIQYEAAKILTQNREAWEAIGKSAVLTWPIYIEYATSENPTGPIPFRISDKERKTLITRIDGMFSDKLDRFYQHRAAVESGREGNPKDQTWVIFGIYGIKKMLSGETYEDQKKNDFKF
jgi:hypothetical protein